MKFRIAPTAIPAAAVAAARRRFDGLRMLVTAAGLIIAAAGTAVRS